MTEVRHTALSPCQHTCRSRDLSDILPDKENLVFDTGIDEGIHCSWIKLSTTHHFNVSHCKAYYKQVVSFSAFRQEQDVLGKVASKFGFLT